MRAQGVVESARGLRPFGHLGWAYRGRAELLTRAAEYIIDGIAEGQWVEYVGAGEPSALRRELASLPELADATEASRVEVSTVNEFYEFDDRRGVVVPSASVATRVAAVEDALAAGYRGFRAVVDATPMVRTAEQREAFARFEYLIDQKMNTLPVSAVCAYDLDELGSRAAAELVCLHPFVGPAAASFRLYVEEPAAFAVSGELDVSCDVLFETTVERVLSVAEPDGVLVIDGRELTFIDHRALLALEHHLSGLGLKGELRTACSVAWRLADLIELNHLRVTPV